jgi:hypothetical protein
MKRKYGVSPVLSSSSLPHPGALDYICSVSAVTSWLSSSAPEVVYLEHAFVW